MGVERIADFGLSALRQKDKHNTLIATDSLERLCTRLGCLHVSRRQVLFGVYHCHWESAGPLTNACACSGNNHIVTDGETLGLLDTQVPRTRCNGTHICGTAAIMLKI